MRIGKVSQIYHISVDNLYYYINYGLLVPPRPKGQYVFDQATIKDLEWILELKELDFSLREIHRLLSLRRISNFADSQDILELAHIHHGIFLTPNKNKNLQDTPDVNRELYKDLPPELISMFQRSYNWMLRKIEEKDLHRKVVAETYINAWFFMHNHLEYLPSDSQYFVIDKYPETLLMYKHLIENQRPDLDILYLADSSTRFPIKPGVIDLHLDFFAVNEHNFYHPTFLYSEIAPFLSPKGELLGTYFYFEGAPKSMKLLLSQYPECYEKNFDLSYFHHSLKESGFQLLEEEDCGCVTDSGNNLGFGFHVKGEKMHLLPYYGRKCT